MIISQNDNKLNMNFKFTDKKISNNVAFTYFENFKQNIGFLEHLNRVVTCKKHHNSKYSTQTIIDYTIDSIILGYSRFSHMNQLKNDPAYQSIKGFSLPDEKVCRNFLKDSDETTVSQLRELNRKVLELKSQNEEVKEVILDFDDTVCHIFGHQEGSGVGYNPKYHGRPSYKVKVGMLSITNELLDVTLESGIHHSNYNFLEFLKDCIANLPSGWIVKRIRADRGMFDEKTFIYLEDNSIEYVVKAKKYNSLKLEIEKLLEKYPDEKWHSINSTYSFAEMNYALPTWERSRRFIIIRKAVSKKQKDLNKLKLFSHDYEYQAIVTNVEYLTPAEVFKDYNKRCNIENNIDHLKDGYYFSENSLANKIANEAFLILKMIAYNIQNWFQSVVFPDELKNKEIGTLRRIFYKIPGIISGSDRYQHIKFAKNTMLEKILQTVTCALQRFKLLKS